MKIITLCGSLKFQKEMIEIARNLALEGNCILTPIWQPLDCRKASKHDLALLTQEHFKKIELSDAILVVNINNYIGNSTGKEIDYAKKLGKEIVYYEDLK